MSSDSGGQAVDFAYLEGFCAGDTGVLTEVLAIFQEQAAKWVDVIAVLGNQGDVAHTIKGAARGIGANALADAAAKAEFGGPADIEAVKIELARALAEIEGYLSRIGGG
jgi:hypothetical protein